VVRKHVSCQLFQETTMQWTAPAFTDLRFGFEITMYIANR
jgi:coenzyme PQQ precursor peptide PqqA